MLNHDMYVREKLKEFEQEQMTRLSLQAPRVPRAARRPAVISPVARGTGRLLRRLGEGLEHWGGHEPEPMQMGRSPR